MSYNHKEDQAQSEQLVEAVCETVSHSCLVFQTLLINPKLIILCRDYFVKLKCCFLHNQSLIAKFLILIYAYWITHVSKVEGVLNTEALTL